MFFVRSMLVDYIRVYREFMCLPSAGMQSLIILSAEDPSKKNIGCDPVERPTAAYIARYPDAYNNPNIVRSTTPLSGTATGSLDAPSHLCTDNMGTSYWRCPKAKE
jgi:hypothetical protein